MIPANLDTLLATAGYKRLGDAPVFGVGDLAARASAPLSLRRSFPRPYALNVDRLHCKECGTAIQSDDAYGYCDECR